ncbi:MAG: GGDEF domain-containing protein [Candidatus Omnitrophota bacterium]|jgi:diguanylate cyclase (GGDEF)-like protein
MDLVLYLEKRSKLFLAALSVASAALAYTIGLAIGPGFFTPTLYIPSLIIASWFIGPRAGIVLSVINTAALSFHDALSVPGYAASASTYWNIAAMLGLFLIISYNISALRNTRASEQNMTKTDSLTGVANRRAFYDLAGIEIHRSRRYNHPFTVAYVDIDNFKIINYRYGHSAGDSLLNVVAQEMKSHVRDVDLVSRFGGDEFAILLPETGAEPSQLVFSRLRYELLDLMKKNDWPVTFSFGVATFLNAPESVEEIIKKASVLMYSAKNHGANTIDQEVISKTQDANNN